MARRNARRWAGAIAVAASLTAAGCSSSNTPASTSGTGSSTGSTPDATQVGVTKNIYGGAAYASSGQPKHGGVLKVGIATPVATLDPSVPVGSSSTTTDEAIYGRLFATDAQGKVIPVIAKSIESTDNQNWTITIPAGMKFTDGTPFDAQAIVDYWKLLGSPASQSLAAAVMREIKTISAANPTTVKVGLDAPNANWSAGIAFGSPDMVPSMTALKAAGAQFGLKPVGAGPFKVKSFQPGGNVVVVANADYPGPKKPYLDEIDFIPSGDESARLQAVRSGSLDVGPVGSATDYKTASDVGLTVLKQPSLYYYGLLLNLKAAPFNDANFRKAVIEAIDLKGLNQAVFSGLETPTQGIVSQSNTHYKKTDWPTYNPTDAKSLVQKFTGSGGKASFKLLLPNPPTYAKMAAILQQMLKQSGIDMQYSVSTPQVMVQQAATGSYQAEMRPQGVSANVAVTVADSFQTGAPYNQGGAGNPALDALLAKAKTATGDQVASIDDQIQDVLAKWMPTVPLVSQAFGFYIGKRVGAFPGGILEGRATVDDFDPTAVWLK